MSIGKLHLASAVLFSVSRVVEMSQQTPCLIGYSCFSKNQKYLSVNEK